MNSLLSTFGTLCFILDKYWSSVVQNAIGCALGSFVAIIFSIYFYFDSLRKNDKSKIEAKKEEEINQLRAFALMLKGVLKMSKKQSASIEDFIAEIKECPNEFPLPTIYPLGGLKRIKDTITIEKTGLAFMKYFPKGNSAKEFITVLEIVDYLHAEFFQFSQFLERASLNHYNRKIEVSKTFDYCNKLVIDFLLQAPRNDVWQRISAIKNNFDNNRGQVDDLKPVYSLFFIPLNNLAMHLINTGVRDDFIRELAFATSKGIEYSTYIDSGYLKFEEEIEQIFKEVQTQIQKFETNTLNILSSEYANMTES